MQSLPKYFLILLLALVTGGCATTYVPISWGYGEKVKELSNTDVVLSTFFSRYDPERSTLRVGGTSFDEVMMPSEVKYHLGAYRQNNRMIYRNLYQKYSDQELRDVMVHEFAHYIWFNFMSPDSRIRWRRHLEKNPSPMQAMVRAAYRPEEYDTEDFAYTVEFPRRVDIEMLATLKVINAEERDAILKELHPAKNTVVAQPAVRTKAAGVAATKQVPHEDKQEEYDPFE